MWLIQHEARQNLQQRGSCGGGDVRKLSAWKSGIQQASEAPLSMGMLGDHSAAFPGGFRERGSVRDQQSHYTGGSSLLIPALSPPPAAPSPDPSSWNAPGPPQLMQPTTQLLPRCFCSRPAPRRGSIPGPRVPPGFPDIPPGTVPRCSGRWHSPIHQGQQGQQPLVRCSHDNQPKRRLPAADRGNPASRTGCCEEDVRPPASAGRNLSSGPPRAVGGGRSSCRVTHTRSQPLKATARTLAACPSQGKGWFPL